MSLDIDLYDPIIETENEILCASCGCTQKSNEGRCVFSLNITHNLCGMADEAGIYFAMWRPEEINIKRASELIQALYDGIEKLKNEPEKYKKLNPDNGWGTYEILLRSAENYLQACRDYPNAKVRADR